MTNPSVSSSSVFDLGSPRSDTSAIRRGESEFDWLNRCGKDRCELARRRINEMFDELPESVRHEYRKRLTSKRRHNFDSAILELVLHRLFRSLGTTVEFPVPESGKSTPEFIVSFSDGESVAVEAHNLMPPEDQSSADEESFHVLEEVQKRVRERGFRFDVLIERSTSRSLPARWMAQELDEYVRECRANPSCECDTLELEREGWRLAFDVAFLDNEDANPFYSRYGAYDKITPDRIVKAVHRKRRQHRHVELDQIIVLGSSHYPDEPSDEDIRIAIWGPIKVGMESDLVGRSRDGLFTNRWRPLSQRIVGVLFLRQCFAHCLESWNGIYSENPLSARKLSPVRFPLTTMRDDGMGLRVDSGRPLPLLLGFGD